MSAIEAAEVSLSKADGEQVKMMEEMCILVDENDNIVGSETKKVCHIKPGLLHRAFSVFLLRKNPETGKVELLLQQRAADKITFPLLWTNTACTHPLFNEELNEKTRENAMGIKRAAHRKLDQELGIKPNMVPIENMHFITRIIYKADNDPSDPSNPWLEWELDHILAIKGVNVETVINPNEVAAVRWITKDDLDKDIAQGNYTPWFKLIHKHLLGNLFADWEKNYDEWDSSKLSTFNDDKIHDFINGYKH